MTPAQKKRKSPTKRKAPAKTGAQIRVLAIDDSAVARQTYRTIFENERGFELIGTAPNAAIGRDKVKKLDPDVLVLDLEMPGTDGLTLLKWLIRNDPRPVVVASALSEKGAEKTMQAFSLGALDVVCKGNTSEEEDFRTRLIASVSAASRARNKIRKRTKQDEVPVRTQTFFAGADAEPVFQSGALVLIGASTGGPEAVTNVIINLPANFPPVVVAQHMPPVYTRSFADRLNTQTELEVREAEGDEILKPGHVYIAPGGKQTTIRKVNGQASLSVEVPARKAHGTGWRYTPCVDFLFRSAVECFAHRVTGVLLTGMGDDGAQGLGLIKKAGGYTIAQDEASCVCYGMPKEAVRLGAAERILALSQIPLNLVQALASTPAKKRNKA